MARTSHVAIVGIVVALGLMATHCRADAVEADPTIPEFPLEAMARIKPGAPPGFETALRSLEIQLLELAGCKPRGPVRVTELHSAIERKEGESASLVALLGQIDAHCAEGPAIEGETFAAVAVGRPNAWKVGRVDYISIGDENATQAFPEENADEGDDEAEEEVGEEEPEAEEDDAEKKDDSTASADADADDDDDDTDDSADALDNEVDPAAEAKQ